MSLTQRLKEHEARTRARVLSILRITEDELAAMIFEEAYQYLEKVFGTDAYGLDHLPKTSEFWVWWKKNWHDIDSVFVGALDFDMCSDNSDILCTIRVRDNSEFYEAVRNVNELRQHYEHYHEASICNRYLNSTVVRAGMHNMIDSIINKQKVSV
jgi:hypothetical protein